MSAAALIERAARQGVTIEARDGALKLSGPSWSVHDLAPAIREAKAALLAHLDPPPLSDTDHEAIREAIEERAAIREFEAGEPRAVADQQAASAMKVFRFRLTDRPGTWLTMLAPGCDLEQARRDLVLRFGEARLIEVRESKP